MKLEPGEMAGCFVILVVFVVFLFWFFIPAMQEAHARAGLASAAITQCRNDGGTLIKDFDGGKLYCARRGYHIVPNWFNGKDAR